MTQEDTLGCVSECYFIREHDRHKLVGFRFGCHCLTVRVALWQETTGCLLNTSLPDDASHDRRVWITCWAIVTWRGGITLQPY